MDIQAPEEVFYLALPPVMNTIHTWIEFKQETTRERLLEEGFESIANALAKRERDVCDLADSYGRHTLADGRAIFGLRKSQKYLIGLIHWVED